ncbi:iron chaperone [Plantibacter sp. Mn2098]|uniref:iron chaperone n=1 Tax=Plantibacter sp. Mn2098 TaxID=3395266 RepID=UPI003BDEFF02
MNDSIEDALAEVPEPQRDALLRVIGIARGIAPDAVDGVSYGMPALKLHGRPLIGVAATAKHLSVFPFSPAVVEAVADRLAGYSLSKGTIRFTVDTPLPEDVIKTIVRTRLAELG